MTPRVFFGKCGCFLLESNAAAFGCLANMVDGSPLLGLYSLRRAEVGRVAQLFAELLAAVDPPLAAHLGSGAPCTCCGHPSAARWA